MGGYTAVTDTASEGRPETQVCTKQISDEAGGCRMRTFLIALFGMILFAGSMGCIIPAYSGDPVRRTEQLLYTSENLREVENTWERFWFLDQPCHMQPYRTHGGIL